MGRCWGLTRNFNRCLRVGEWKLFCSEHKKQPIVWMGFLIFTVGVGVLAYINYFFAAAQSTFKEPNNQQLELEQRDVKPFKKETYGILVSGFEGDSAQQEIKSKEIQGSITNTLNAIFKESDIPSTEARRLPDSIRITTHQKAREIGKKYNADIVIWGNITIAGYITKITIADYGSASTQIIPPETTLLKDELTHSELAKINDIRLGPFTDEPALLALFVTGMNYYEKENLDKAFLFFKKSLPHNPKIQIDVIPINFYLGTIRTMQKQYDDAIKYFNDVLKINPN